MSKLQCSSLRSNVLIRVVTRCEGLTTQMLARNVACKPRAAPETSMGRHTITTEFISRALHCIRKNSRSSLNRIVSALFRRLSLRNREERESAEGLASIPLTFHGRFAHLPGRTVVSHRSYYNPARLYTSRATKERSE